MALGQVCGGHSVTVPGLWWTQWHCARFVVDTVPLGPVCVQVLELSPVSIIPTMLLIHLPNTNAILAR